MHIFETTQKIETIMINHILQKQVNKRKCANLRIVDLTCANSDTQPGGK